jgi:hypothetical protein
MWFRYKRKFRELNIAPVQYGACTAISQPTLTQNKWKNLLAKLGTKEVKQAEAFMGLRANRHILVIKLKLAAVKPAPAPLLGGNEAHRKSMYVLK